MCPTIFGVIYDMSAAFYTRFIQLTADIFITTKPCSFFVIFPHPTCFIKVNIYFINSQLSRHPHTYSLASSLASSLHHTDFDVWVYQPTRCHFFLK